MKEFRVAEEPLHHNYKRKLRRIHKQASERRKKIESKKK
jgi:hypothetical protein